MKIIDLSHTIESSPQDLPDFLRVDVSYSDHQAGAQEFQEAFGIPPRLFRNGEGPAGERLSIGTHAGTHLDAPYHYNSRQALGAAAPGQWPRRRPELDPGHLPQPGPRGPQDRAGVRRRSHGGGPGRAHDRRVAGRPADVTPLPRGGI